MWATRHNVVCQTSLREWQLDTMLYVKHHRQCGQLDTMLYVNHHRQWGLQTQCCISIIIDSVGYRHNVVCKSSLRVWATDTMLYVNHHWQCGLETQCCMSIIIESVGYRHNVYMLIIIDSVGYRHNVICQSSLREWAKDTMLYVNHHRQCGLLTQCCMSTIIESVG